MSEDSEWFEVWFDSPYYDLLYRHRDADEAASFLEKLLNELALDEKSRILDLACGKGRHSLYLADKGYRVVGIDLSANNISSAKKLERPGLKFMRDDMRTFDLGTTFDAIFNLFTSFGYFSDKSDNQRVLDRVACHLRDQGVFVIDYFNPQSVLDSLVSSESRHFEDVNIQISRFQEGDKLIKEILVTQGDLRRSFREVVQIFSLAELENMIRLSGLTIVRTFGGYDLSPYNKDSSGRIILVARK